MRPSHDLMRVAAHLVVHQPHLGLSAVMPPTGSRDYRSVADILWRNANGDVATSPPWNSPERRFCVEGIQTAATTETMLSVARQVSNPVAS